MVDPVGASLGVLGLASLFTTVVDVWDFVDAGRGYAERFSYLKTRLDNQREIFVQWGRRMEFGSYAGHNPRLDDPQVRPRIEASLMHIKLLFTNTEELVKRYGVKIEEKEINGVIQHSVQIWKPSFDRFRSTLRRNQREASAFKVTRWSIRDADKFKNMVDCVAALLSDLNEMTRDFVSQHRYEEIAREEVNTIDDVRQLEQVQQAIGQEGGYVETILSSAVSVRQGLLQQRNLQTPSTDILDYNKYAEDVLSIVAPSFDPSFHTSRTHQNQVLGGERPLDLQMRDPGSDNQIIQNINGGEPDFEVIKAANVTAIKLVFGTENFTSTSYDSIHESYPHLHEFSKRLIKEYHRSVYDTDGGTSPIEKLTTWAPLDPSNLNAILASIRGPRETLYEGGIFHLRININPSYPVIAPTCWFITKIYHPNIDKKGAICLDVLTNKWIPALGVDTIIISIQALLGSPNWYEPIDLEAGNLYRTDRSACELKAREWTRLYATGEIIYPGTREDGFSNTTG